MNPLRPFLALVCLLGIGALGARADTTGNEANTVTLGTAETAAGRVLTLTCTRRAEATVASSACEWPNPKL